MIVIEVGTTEALKLLRDLTAEPAKVDVDGWNVLHWAVFHGYMIIMVMLITKKTKGGWL